MTHFSIKRFEPRLFNKLLLLFNAVIIVRTTCYNVPGRVHRLPQTALT